MATTPRYQRYRALHLLGRGSTAAVYAGRKEKEGLELVVALKYLRREHLNDEVYRRRFHREGQIGFSLNHPNIITTREIDDEDGVPLLVLDLVGPSLEAVRDRILCDDEVAGWVAAEGLSALGYLASQRVVHRDVSLANLLIDPSGRVRLGDFGIATRFDSSVTPGPIGGTWPYISPELTQGDRGSTASDLFSLGALLYELVSGDVPFGREPETIIDGHRLGAPPLPRSIPRYLRAVIAGLLEPDPRLRLTADQAARMLRAPDERAAVRLGRLSRAWLRERCPNLRHPLDGVATDAIGAPRPLGTRPPPRWRRASAVATATLCLAGVAIGGWLGLSSRPDGVAPAAPVSSPSVPEDDGPHAQPRDEPSPVSETPASPPTTDEQTQRSAEQDAPRAKPDTVDKRSSARQSHASVRALAAELNRKGVGWRAHPRGGGVLYKNARREGSTLRVTIKPMAPFNPSIAVLEETDGTLGHPDSSGWMELSFTDSRLAERFEDPIKVVVAQPGVDGELVLELTVR